MFEYRFKKIPELLFGVGVAVVGAVWLTIQDWDYDTVREDPEAAIAVVAAAAGRAAIAVVMAGLGKLFGGGA